MPWLADVGLPGDGASTTCRQTPVRAARGTFEPVPSRNALDGRMIRDWLTADRGSGTSPSARRLLRLDPYRLNQPGHAAQSGPGASEARKDHVAKAQKHADVKSNSAGRARLTSGNRGPRRRTVPAQLAPTVRLPGPEDRLPPPATARGGPQTASRPCIMVGYPATGRGRTRRSQLQRRGRPGQELG